MAAGATLSSSSTTTATTSKPQTSPPPLSAASKYPLWALVVGSILTTVVLVIVNKKIFQGGFPFVMSLSSMHFAATYLFMMSLSAMGMFEKRFLPTKVNFLVGGMGVASIAFMNYSLRYNSVGTYQMAKLCVIPTVLVQQIVSKGEWVSRKIFLSLCFILFGVGGATVTDVTVTSLGLAYASAAVVSTAQYQVWQGSKQREHGLSEMQMTMSVAFAQLVIGGVVALLVEGSDLFGKYFSSSSSNTSLVSSNPSENELSSSSLIGMIFCSCLLAVSANLHSFAFIGRTSAVSFQVTGHGKTLLILISGYLLFPLPESTDLVSNIIAVSVAVIGVVLYTSVKQHENAGVDGRDLYDVYAPSFLLNLLEPERHRHTMVPNVEEEGNAPKP